MLDLDGVESLLRGVNMPKGVYTRTIEHIEKMRAGWHKQRGEGCQKHGHRLGGTSPTYQSWRAMIKRCEYPTTNSFEYYGGRGIKVCERWHSFEKFLADMGERPKGKSIDRFPDVNGNYEPTNCRWASPLEQTRNRGGRAHAATS
jgi:hypothetical protein